MNNLKVLVVDDMPEPNDLQLKINALLDAIEGIN